MADSNTIDVKNSIRLGSVLILSLPAICLDNSRFSVLSAWWALLLLIAGNVRRFDSKNKISYFIRITLYFLPYAFPALIAGNLSFSVDSRVLYSCAGVALFFVIWLAFNLKPVKLTLSSQIIAESRKESRYRIILRIYSLVGAAICEELFFRQYILTIDSNILIPGTVSIVYFVLSHWLLPWSRQFSKNDYINQALFGGINVLAFILSGSVIPCMMLHILMNSIGIVRLAREYDRHYIRAEKYDRLLGPEEYPELDL